MHYDGLAWTASPSGVTEDLTGVTETAPDDVWVTGNEGSILHWDGISWTTSSQVAGTQLLAVWASGTTNVWAVGIDLDSGNGYSAGYVRNWNGSTWNDADVPVATSLWEVWGSGPDDIWMVGDDTSGRRRRHSRERNGLNNPFDTLDYAGASLRGVWGTGPNDVWVAPYHGPDRTLGWHVPGPRATTTSAPPGDSLLGHRGKRNERRLGRRPRRTGASLRRPSVVAVGNGTEQRSLVRLEQRARRRLGGGRRWHAHPLERLLVEPLASTRGAFRSRERMRSDEAAHRRVPAP